MKLRRKIQTDVYPARSLPTLHPLSHTTITTHNTTSKTDLSTTRAHAQLDTPAYNRKNERPRLALSCDRHPVYPIHPLRHPGRLPTILSCFNAPPPQNPLLQALWLFIIYPSFPIIDNHAFNSIVALLFLLCGLLFPCPFLELDG